MLYGSLAKLSGRLTKPRIAELRKAVVTGALSSFLQLRDQSLERVFLLAREALAKLVGETPHHN